MQQEPTKTIQNSGMPARIAILCDGLLKLNADFFKHHLNIVLSEFEAALLKDTERFGSFEAHSEQLLYLRNFKRVRHEVIPLFLCAFETRLAGIRHSTSKQSSGTVNALRPKLTDLSLVESDYFQQHQFLSVIAAHCESLNNLELHALNQRLAVLAGQAPFANDMIPIGPYVFCTCLQESIQGAGLNEANTEALFSFFEKCALSKFHTLLESCNEFLANNGILVNLNFTTYRNPELRFKKSAIALEGPPSIHNPKPLVQQHDSLIAEGHQQRGLQSYSSAMGNAAAQATGQETGRAKFGFEDFRRLLADKKRILSEHDSFESNSFSVTLPAVSTRAVSASKAIISGILGEFQRSESSEPGMHTSVKHIKQNLQSQLVKISTQGREFTLAAEDSDAIDIFGMVMDSAINKLKPNSATSQLMAMLQAPLINIILQDKSFFENHMHPARKMLDALAETGMNWLDVNDRDEKLFEKVNELVSGISIDSGADSQKLLATYEETNRLLQSLIKKAEAIERRQIEIVKGKERLIIARERAEQTLEDLITGHTVSEFAQSILRGAWTDVLVLTELRCGFDSQQWQQQKEIALNIIAIGDPTALANESKAPLSIKEPIEASLQLVGYSIAEATDVANALLNKRATADPMLSHAAANNQDPKAQANKPAVELLPSHVRIIRELKQLPFGTWFEFYFEGDILPERRKMAWASHTTHNMLFVNPRGQKVAEIPMQELAHDMYLGRVKLAKEDRRSFFERTFESVMDSLRDLLPGSQEAIREQ